jgi:hypothetical protein
VRAVQSSGPALDGALHRVLRHVAFRGLFHCHPQPRIAGHVGTADTGGDGDLLDQPGEEGAALGVLAPLAVLDVGPFGVAGHEDPRLI